MGARQFPPSFVPVFRGQISGLPSEIGPFAIRSAVWILLLDLNCMLDVGCWNFIRVHPRNSWLKLRGFRKVLLDGFPWRRLTFAPANQI